MEIARKLLAPTASGTEPQQWPGTAQLRYQTGNADRFERVKRNTLFTVSVAVICIVFPVALAIAVYYLASLIWQI